VIFNFKIRFLLAFIIIFIFSSTNSNANLKKNLIEKINKTKTISFSFEQKISDKIETGQCIIKYQKLIKCDYNDKYKKRLISNGKTLAVIQRRYKKIFYYPLSSTPLEYILDKYFLINKIENNVINNFNKTLAYISYEENGYKIDVFFNKEKLILSGWNTVDLYNNRVQFKISNAILNQKVAENFFKIPKLDDLN
tara:strand:- start:497 stop:1081 length:585 start_codon:yes stop_codon:yes gene_type:complete